MAKMTVRNCARAAAFAFAAAAFAPLPAQAESRAARRHDGGRHSGLDRPAGPGLRRLPLRRLVAVRRLDHLGPVALATSRPAARRPRHQVGDRSQRQQAMDLRSAPGREVPRRLRLERRRRIWNFERLINDKAPQLPAPFNFARRAFAHQLHRPSWRRSTTTRSRSTPRCRSRCFPTTWRICDGDLEMRGREAPATTTTSTPRRPSGTGPYKFDKRGAARAPRAGEEPRLLGQGPRAQARPAGAAADAGGDDARRRAAVRAGGFGRGAVARRHPARSRRPACKIITNVYPHNWPYQLNFRTRPVHGHARAPGGQLRHEPRGDGRPAGRHGDGRLRPLHAAARAYYGKPVKYTFDPKKATALLKEAGCLPCKITLAISHLRLGPDAAAADERAGEGAARGGGFKVKFEVMDWNALLDVFCERSGEVPQVDAHQLSSRRVLDPLSGFLQALHDRQPRAGRPQLGLVLQIRRWMRSATRSRRPSTTAEQDEDPAADARDGGARIPAACSSCTTSTRAPVAAGEGLRPGAELVPGHDADHGQRQVADLGRIAGPHVELRSPPDLPGRAHRARRQGGLLLPGVPGAGRSDPDRCCRPTPRRRTWTRPQEALRLRQAGAGAVRSLARARGDRRSRLSLQTSRPVLVEVTARCPTPSSSPLCAVLLAFTLAFVLGAIAAYYVGRPIDRVVTGIAVVGVSVPNYWLGIVLVIIFAVELGCCRRPAWARRARRLQHLRLGAGEVRDPAGHHDGDGAARHHHAHHALRGGRGAEPGFRRRRCAPRAWASCRCCATRCSNALPQVLAVMGLQFGYLVGGSILIETIFTWPGTGFLLSKAIMTRDIPVLQGAILILALSFVATNLVVDLLQTAVDPRIKRSLRRWRMSRHRRTPRSARAFARADAAPARGARLLADGRLPAALRLRDAVLRCASSSLIVLAAIFAPLLAPFDPYKTSMVYRLKPIGFRDFALGTDELGRDMLSRLHLRRAMSLLMGLGAGGARDHASAATLGVIAGFVGGRVNMRSCARWTCSTRSPRCCWRWRSPARWAAAWRTACWR